MSPLVNAEQFRTNPRHPQAAGAAACGLLGWGCLAVGATTSSTGLNLVAAVLLLVPGWYVFQQARRRVGGTRRETLLAGSGEVVLGFYALRMAWFLIKVVAAIIAGLPATVVCLVLALYTTGKR